MNVREDKVNVTVMIDGKQAINSLGLLEMEAQDIRTAMKGMTKDTEEFKKSAAQLNKVTSDITKLRNEIGLTGMTMTQLRNTQRDLNKEINNVTAGTPRYNELKTKLQEVNGVIQQQQAEIKNVGKASQGISATMSSFFGGMASGLAQQALGQLIDFGKGSLKAYEESKQSTAQLRASLESTGGAAGLTEQEINKLSASLQKLHNIDDDVTNSSAALLLTFTDIKKGVFEESIPLIQDMAVKMAGGNGGELDLKSATIQVGKALNDPIKGITALSKVGVSFSEDQKKVIERLVATGDKASAQKIILEELNKEFGGSAKAAADAQGSMGDLNVTLAEIQENLGEKLLPAVESTGEAFVEVLENIEPVQEAFSGYVGVLDSLWDTLMRLVRTIVPFNEGTSNTSVIMKGLGFGINVALVPLKLFATGLEFLIDEFIAVYDTGKRVLNFFGTEFKVDPEATFGKGFSRVGDNVKKIGRGFADVFTDQKKGAEEVTDKNASELKKQEKDVRKQQELYKKMLADANQEEENAEAFKNDKKVKSAQKRADQELRIKLQQLEKFREAEDKYDKEQADAEKKNADQIAEGREAEFRYEKDLKSKKLQAQIALNDLEILQAKGHSDKLLQLHLERLELEKQKEIASAEQTGADVNVIKEKYIELEKQLRLNNTVQIASRDLQYAQQALQQFTQLYDAISQRKINKEEAAKNKALEILEKEHNSKKVSEVDYNRKKEQITKQYDDRISAAKNKQAKIDHAAAIIQAAIQGTLAIMQAISSSPPPVNIPIIAVQAALVAGGVAAVAATPVPEYAEGGFTFSDGGHIGKETYGRIGEKGPEYVISNPMLQNPQVANFVSMLENMRTARAFASGGFTTSSTMPGSTTFSEAPKNKTYSNESTSSTSGNNIGALIYEVKNMTEEIKKWEGRIHLVYTDFTKAEELMAKIKTFSTLG